MRWVNAAVLTCAVAFAPTSAVWATQLGSVSAVSLLGQPLRIEIDAPGATAEYAARCAQLVTPTAEPDGIPAVLDARLTVAGSGPDAQLVVSHGAPVRDPILRIAVRDVCDSRHQREYTLLLPLATSIAPASVTAPSAPVAAAPVRSSTPRSSAGAPAAEVWVTVPGESIATLAQALHPRNAQARRALMARLFDLNPELARNGLSATMPLPPGTQLRVPSPAQQAAQAPDTAVIARPARKAAPIVDNASRLVLEGETEERPDTASVRKDGAPDETSEDAREQRLVKAIDDSIKAELELFERIRRLEEIEQALRARLTVPPPQPVVPPVAATTPVAATPASEVPERTASAAPTPPPPPTRTTWAQWMFLLAALACVIALILFHETRRIMRTRPPRQATATQEQEQEPLLEDDAAAITQLPRPRLITPTVTRSRDTGSDARPPMHSFTPAEPESTTTRVQPPPPRADLAFDAESTSPLIVNEEVVEEHDSAVELADIMISFGRVHGAAETLSDFIRANPRQSVTPWIKLMEVYRLADMRIEFDALARQLNKTFNVKAVTWDNFDEARTMPDGIEQLPHAIDQLVALWGTTACQAYLDRMLRDNRDGTRQGLSLGIIDDILMLWSVLEDQLGRFHGDHLGHAA